MASTSLDTMSDDQKLKVTVLCDVRKICQEVASRLKNKVVFSNEALELTAEIVWRKVQDFGSDLELFARHRKHTYINPEDVKLLVRKNEHLRDRMVKLAEELSSTNTKRKKKEKDSDNLITDTGPGDAGDDRDNLTTNTGPGPDQGDAADHHDDMIGNFDIELIDLDEDSQ